MFEKHKNPGRLSAGVLGGIEIILICHEDSVTLLCFEK